MSHRRARQVYWGSTASLAVLMLVSAGGDLFRFQPFVDDLRRLGYPDHLLTLLGIAKLLGVAALLYPGIPRIREWAYAGFTFDLGGATISQVAAGSTVAQILPPALCAALLAVSYLSYRAAGRQLTDTRRGRSGSVFPGGCRSRAPLDRLHRRAGGVSR